MLVRIARREPRARDVTHGAAARARVLAVLAAGLMIVTCGSRATPAATLSAALSTSSPTVGPTTLTVTLRSSTGGAIPSAIVRLEGHMSHPGMTPVIAAAFERSPGDYVVPFTFTMPGDWSLLVSATLPDGGRVEKRIEVANVRP